MQQRDKKVRFLMFRRQGTDPIGPFPWLDSKVLGGISACLTRGMNVAHCEEETLQFRLCLPILAHSVRTIG
jgi:hypothetical protein